MTRADYDPSCDTCAHAIEHHWFGLPTGTTHCPRRKPDGKHCHATWSGFAATHCVICHRTFSSPSALDRHRIPRGGLHCVDPAMLRKKDGVPVFTSFVNDWGTTIWRQTGPEARPWADNMRE